MAYNSSDFDRNDSGEVINNNIFDIDFEDLDLLGKNGGSESGNGTKVGEGSYFPTYGLDGGVGGMDWESSTGGVMDSMLGNNNADFDFGPLDLSKTDFSKHFNTVPVNTNEEDAAFLGSSSAAAWSVYMSPAVFTPFNHPPSSVFDYLPEPTSSYLESDAHPTNLFDNDPLFGTPHPLLGGSNLSTPADEPLPITPLTDGNARQPAIRQNSNADSMAQFDMSSVMGSATQFDINSPIIGMNDISMDFPNASLFPSLFNNKKRYSPVGTSSSLSAPPVFPQASTSLSAPPVFPQASTSSPVVPMLSPPPMMSPALRSLRSPSLRSPPVRASPYVRTPISIDAPTQSRAYLTPSATSRKVIPAFMDKKMGRLGSNISLETVRRNRQSPHDSPITEVPQEIQEAIEKKRRANCVSARKLRAKKQEHVKELEKMVADLRGEIEVLKARAGVAEEGLRLRRTFAGSFGMLE